MSTEKRSATENSNNSPSGDSPGIGLRFSSFPATSTRPNSFYIYVYQEPVSVSKFPELRKCMLSPLFSKKNAGGRYETRQFPEKCQNRSYKYTKNQIFTKISKPDIVFNEAKKKGAFLENNYPFLQELLPIHSFYPLKKRFRNLHFQHLFFIFAYDK